MKYILSLVLCLTIASASAQNNLTAEQWRQDLKYFQNLVHEKYEPIFYRVSKEEFDHAVAALDKDIPNLERHEIIVGFAKIAAMFKYGHMGMPLAYAMHGETLKTGFSLIPINFYLFKDGLFVQAVHKDYQKAVGAKVIRIGNMSVHEAMQAIRPTVSIENEQFFKAYGIGNLAIPEVLHALRITNSMSSVPIVFEKNGEQFTLELSPKANMHFPGHYGFVFGDPDWVTSAQFKQPPLWLKNIRRNYHFEYLEDAKTVYVRQSQINDDPTESISQFYERVFKFVEHNPVDKFVLDLRINGGGNNYKNKPVILGLIKSKINEKGKLFTIIGRRTFSAAQNLVNELEQYTETTFIGEPTAESVNFFGDVNTEVLPISGLSVRLSYMWWQDKDPRDTRVWTAPEINIELSSHDYVQGKDPVLEAALNYRPYAAEAMTKIRAAYRQIDYTTAEKIALEFQGNPETQFATITNQLNALGYEYMGKHDLKTAFAIFKLNVKLYPKCANCWDSLAEAYFNAEDYKKAIEYYEKAYALEPTTPTGQHAKERAEQIKAHAGN